MRLARIKVPGGVKTPMHAHLAYCIVEIRDMETGVKAGDSSCGNAMAHESPNNAKSVNEAITIEFKNRDRLQTLTAAEDRSDDMSSCTRCAIIAAIVLFSASAAQAAECDRDCLRGMITKYVDALVAHAPQSLPLAPNVRFTEDSRQLPLGEGAWKTVTRAGSFRQDYLYVRRGIAASHVELHEEGAQLQYSVALRIVDQKITGLRL